MAAHSPRQHCLALSTMQGRRPRGSVNNISNAFPGMAVMSAVRSEGMPEGVSEGMPGERCPHCGAIKGGTAGALDALYQEVRRLTELAGTREAELLREIRLLQETVARLRGGIVMLHRYVTET